MKLFTWAALGLPPPAAALPGRAAVLAAAPAPVALRAVDVPVEGRAAAVDADPVAAFAPAAPVEAFAELAPLAGADFAADGAFAPPLAAGYRLAPPPPPPPPPPRPPPPPPPPPGPRAESGSVAIKTAVVTAKIKIVVRFMV